MEVEECKFRVWGFFIVSGEFSGISRNRKGV